MSCLYRLFRTLPWEKYNKQLAKKYFGYAIPVFLLVSTNSIIGFSDKLILQHYTNTEELGYYSAAMSLGGMILILGGTIGTIFPPLFSSLIKKNDWKEVNSKIHTFQTFITTFIFPFICLLAIISEPFLTTILGNKYQPSVVPFAILLFASYFFVVGMSYGNRNLCITLQMT